MGDRLLLAIIFALVIATASLPFLAIGALGYYWSTTGQ